LGEGPSEIPRSLLLKRRAEKTGPFSNGPYKIIAEEF
jgi:hypothetical protein